MTVSELRFPAVGLKLFRLVLELSALGIAAIVWGVVILVFDPWDWEGAIFLLGGAFIGGLGVVFTALVWFIAGLGVVTTWRRWRQLRQPGVVISPSGVCYLPRRGAVAIPWADVERVVLDRTILAKSVVTKVFIRLAPDAALLRDGTVTVSATRNLNVGLLSDVAVSEDAAVRFLRETAGDRLEVTEDDRREPAYGQGGQ